MNAWSRRTRRTGARAAATALIVLVAACGNSQSPREPGVSGAIVRDGHARFTVLSPTLVRLEYADDDRFEDGPTQTVIGRPAPSTGYTTEVVDGVRTIRTSALTLRYVQDSGPFTPDNLAIEVAGAAETARPAWGYGTNPQNLGGWRRALDNEQDPQPLNEGLLSRAGWYLLDDSQTVRITAAPPGFAERPARAGAYQDGYFFGYGQDYVQGLADLRALTGPAPLLPRKAFGVWFSRYWAYSDAELRELVAQFREHAVPLDTLSLDTDWKRMHDAQGCVIFDAVAGARPGDPCSWNGWGWEPSLFPDPPDFIEWAHAQGLLLGANVHPSINSNDPAFTDVQAASGGLSVDQSVPPCTLYQADPTGQCHVFDWTQPAQLDAYLALHAPFEELGIDFWWLDWCCDGSSADAPGLAADTWINAQYAQRSRARGSRWPVFSRIGASFQEGDAGIGNNGAGAFADHRYTLHFTGDTCATWEMLAYQAEFTSAEGSIGMPYVSHDIGSFLGPPQATTGCNGTLGHTGHLPDDMYVRWVQFGTFQPLDRLHSHHGDRLPWEYPGAAEAAATQFLRLRERLVPFLYTLARHAYDSGLPMTRALYLQWPGLDAAYQFPGQFMLGDDVLVAVVAAPGNPASVDVWIPPGTWIDYFTGEVLAGPQVVTRSVGYEQYPVFLRKGAILPTQPDVATTRAGPQDGLTLTVWAGADGAFELYDDEGDGLGYERDAFQRIALATATDGACVSVGIGPAVGDFPGALAQRQWTVRIVGVPMPRQVTIDGQVISGWSYDAATGAMQLDTGPRDVRDRLDLESCS